MMNTNSRLILVLLMALAVAQGAVGQEVLDLWSVEPPHFKTNDLQEYIKESWGVPCVYAVTRPTLTIYRAEGENSRRAMVVLPGGGYEVESIVAEGQQIAEALASQGVTAAVLKYRLPLTEASDAPQLVPAADAHRAIGLMRSLADKYGFDRSKVGVMGFSAGGHLATTVSVHPSPERDENPDFSGLIYPVTTLSPANLEWLEETLYHRAMTDQEKNYFSLVDHVGASTPPAFLVHAYDDDLVPISESLAYAAALDAAGQDVDLLFFAKGGHGFGPGRPEDGTDQWLALLANWIRRQ